MANPKKRPAEEAFVEHEPETPKSKKRRRRDKRKQLVKDEEMTDVSVLAQSTQDAISSQLVKKEESGQVSPPQAGKKLSTPTRPRAEPVAKELTQLASRRQKKDKKTKKSKQKLEIVKQDSPNNETQAVLNPDSKSSGRKQQTTRWNLSRSIGGIFIDQDPILADGEKYLILPTAGGIQVYSTKTSLLVRTLHVSERDPVTGCMPDSADPSHLFVSRLSGLVQYWDWTKGQRQEQWQVSADLLKIVGVMVEAPGQYKLLTIHGALGDTTKLMQSVVSASSSLPDQEEVILSREGYWSACKFVDKGKVLFVASGKQLAIGQLLPVSKGSNDKAYTWREVMVPEPIKSMDVQVRDRPKTINSSPVKMTDVVIGCKDGSIIVYEDLLYRLIGRVKGIRDIEILSRRLHWHRQEVNTVKWSRDGNYLVSGGNETVLVIWQLDTNQQQFLPHLSTSILNLTLSDAGSSYVLRLADNSVMMLSTADLLPSANISGLALKEDPSHQVTAALNSRDPDQLLVAVHADPLIEEPSSATMLQSFDTRTARQVSRQALARNMITALRSAPDGGRVHEPNVSQLKISHDGNWLVTVDEWRPKPHDLDALYVAEDGQPERSQSTETCLRFWKWQDEGSTWELVTRVDEPHASGRKSVLDLAMHPKKLEASTIGFDGMLHRWSPMARYRDGVAVKDKSGQHLYTWMCSKSTRLEPEQPTLNNVNEASAVMTYSEDGSVIAASWSWSPATRRVVHIINARTAELSLTQANILSAGPAQLAFSGRYLLALTHKFCIWDTVALKKTYSVTLQHTARDGKFLAANVNDGTFALAFDSRQPMVPSSVAVFDATDPGKGPLHQGKIPGHVRIMLPHIKSPGYLIVDSDARIRHLTPPGAHTSIAPIAVAKTDDPTKGLKDIFGARSAITSNLEDGTGSGSQLALPSMESNAEQRSLDGVLSSITSSRLPSVRQMFEQVVGLFAKKPTVTP
jgi:NET1-associated nuclear protein 1 (U3 small nucleolar RNA-associated protein 17)